MTKINIQQICSITRQDRQKCNNYVYIEPYTTRSWFKQFYNRGGFSTEYYLSGRKHIDESEREIGELSELYIQGKTVYYKPNLRFRMSNQQCFTKYFESVQELEFFLEEEVLKHIKVITI
jgi:hypothetical protein